MRKHILITIILVLAIAGFITAGLLVWQADRQEEAVIAGIQAQIDQLTADAAVLETKLAGLTTAEADRHAAQTQEIQKQAQELQGQLEALQTEIVELQTYLEENKEAIDKVAEELTYLQGVYDELKHGLEQVNGYLAEG